MDFNSLFSHLQDLGLHRIEIGLQKDGNYELLASSLYDWKGNRLSINYNKERDKYHISDIRFFFSYSKPSKDFSSLNIMDFDKEPERIEDNDEITNENGLFLYLKNLKKRVDVCEEKTKLKN